MVAVSSVSTSTPRSIRSSRRCGPAKRERSHARARRRHERPRAQRRAASTRAAAARPTAPSHPQTSRQRPSEPASRAAGPRPGAAPTLSRVSSSSDSRAMSGAIPACSSRRSSSRALQERADESTPSNAVERSGRTRSATRVITPNAPSEPSTSCRSDGPAAVPGASSVASEPHRRGALQRRDLRVDAPVPGRRLPAERVAAQPPTVAHS